MELPNYISLAYMHSWLVIASTQSFYHYQFLIETKAQICKTFQHERDKTLAELSRKENESKELKIKLDRLRECDPEVLKEVQQKTKVAKESANRWTDNIFSVKSWCKRKFAIEESAINKNFQIPEDLDYLD